MKNENWLKEREREENIMSSFFWAHNEKPRGDSKHKVSKTFKKGTIFEKASHKGNWQTNIFRRENKEERFPFFFWKRVVDSEKNKNKRKEKNKKKRKETIKTEKTQKNKKKKVQK